MKNIVFGMVPFLFFFARLTGGGDGTRAHFFWQKSAITSIFLYFFQIFLSKTKDLTLLCTLLYVGNIKKSSKEIVLQVVLRTHCPP